MLFLISSLVLLFLQFLLYHLKSLYIHEGILNPDFKKEIQDYEIEVPYGITSLTIEEEVEDILSTAEIIGNENLQVGNNEVKIEVTAEDGQVRTYTIKVRVQTEEEYSNRLSNSFT